MIEKRYRYLQLLVAFITLFVLMASFYLEFFPPKRPCTQSLIQRFISNLPVKCARVHYV